jgi:hypothetical protein
VYRPTANGFVDVATFTPGGGQQDGFPYGAATTTDNAFLAQSSRVLILDARDQVLEPAVSFDPTSLDFGPVLLGSTADLDLKITNSGDAALSIEVVRMGGENPNAFSIVSGSETGRLLPGEARDVVVRFSPVNRQVIRRRSRS